METVIFPSKKTYNAIFFECQAKYSKTAKIFHEKYKSDEIYYE